MNMNELLEILRQIKPHVDFENETGLIDNQLLSSLDIVKLVAMLCDEYDIEITVRELIPENFNSAKAIMAMIERLEEE